MLSSTQCESVLIIAEHCIQSAYNAVISGNELCVVLHSGLCPVLYYLWLYPHNPHYAYYAYYPHQCSQSSLSLVVYHYYILKFSLFFLYASVGPHL